MVCQYGRQRKVGRIAIGVVRLHARKEVATPRAPRLECLRHGVGSRAVMIDAFRPRFL